MIQSPVYHALKTLACALVDPQLDTDALTLALANVDDWHLLAEQAEIHGLSVMLGRFAKEKELALPRAFDLQLKALTIRHQKTHAARTKVLADVIDCFDENNITFALLKGAALAQLIYTPAWIRPMRDIDILVSPDKAMKAQKLLRSVGFENEDSKTGYLSEHHHLPNSTRTQDDFLISLEVHHDALSGDVDAAINFNNLQSPLQTFTLAPIDADNHDETLAYALGHADMLKHLCHHTFEPANVIKLGSMVDFVKYAHHFHDEIDWHNIDKQANISNALRCIHGLISLPEPLRTTLKAGDASSKLKSKGQGFMPLSQITDLSSKTQKLRTLLLPSAWWMHIFYNIEPRQSLLWARSVRHPLTVIKWLIRRYTAARRNPD